MSEARTKNCLSYDQLSDGERQLIARAWSAVDTAFVPYSYFPVGVAILVENESGESSIFSGGNIQNPCWDVDCCAERAVTISAFEQGWRKFRTICMITAKKPGGAPCGLCRQVLAKLAPHAKLLSIQNKNNDVKVWQVPDLLPEAKVRQVVPIESLDKREKELALLAIEKAQSSSSPYSSIADGTALLARNEKGEEKVFDGIRIENGVYGGTISAARVAAHSAVTAGYRNFLSTAVYANGPIDSDDSTDNGLSTQEFVSINGACLQTLRQFGLNTKVFNVSISKKLVGCATIDEMLPDSFGPDAVT